MAKKAAKAASKRKTDGSTAQAVVDSPPPRKSAQKTPAKPPPDEDELPEFDVDEGDGEGEGAEDYYATPFDSDEGDEGDDLPEFKSIGPIDFDEDEEEQETYRPTRNRLRTAAPRGKSQPGQPGLPTNFPPPGQYVLPWSKFREYWRKVYDNPDTQHRLVAYGYRTYPVMLPRRTRIYRLEGKEAKPLTLEDIQHQFGSGSYNLKLNDSLAGNRQIVQCKLTEHPELADLRKLPPILDPEDLDEDNPNNASYLRLRRMLGNTLTEEDEDDDVRRNNEETERAISTLTKALVSQRQEGGGSNTSVELMSEAARKAIELVSEQAKSAAKSGDTTKLSELLEIADKLRPQQPSVDPMTSLQPFLNMMEKSADARVEMMREQVNTVMQMMEKIAEREKAAISSKPPDNPNPSSKEQSLLEKVQELTELRDSLKALGGSTGRGSSGPDWATMIPMIVQAAAPLLNSVQQLIYAAVLNMANKSGAAPPPQMQSLPAGAQPGQGSGQGVGQGQGQGHPQPGQPGQPGQAQPQTSAGFQQQMSQAGIDPASQQQVVHFLEQIRQPLINFVRDEERTGYDFAEFFVMMRSEAEYDGLCQAGAENLINMLKTYPPIWSELAHREPQVIQFIGEFIEWGSGEPEEEGEGEQASSEESHTAQPEAPQEAASPTNGPVEPPTRATPQNASEAPKEPPRIERKTKVKTPPAEEQSQPQAQEPEPQPEPTPKPKKKAVKKKAAAT